MTDFKLRSISEKENYATYLALPVLELSKYSFGEDNFMNSYLTVNGNIGVLVKDIDAVTWTINEHRYYRTDMPYYDGALILFKCPKWFEEDMVCLLDNKFSKLSPIALREIKYYSGMIIDWQNKDGTTSTHRLIQAIRKEDSVRAQLAEHLGAIVTEDMELEPAMRDQDILHDVDTDISFIYEEYSRDKVKN